MRRSLLVGSVLRTRQQEAQARQVSSSAPDGVAGGPVRGEQLVLAGVVESTGSSGSVRSDDAVVVDAVVRGVGGGDARRGARACDSGGALEVVRARLQEGQARQMSSRVPDGVVECAVRRERGREHRVLAGVVESTNLTRSV